MNELIVRQFQCIVISNKDNLNSQNWALIGDGNGKKGTFEGFYLSSGITQTGIKLVETPNDYFTIPTKSYIDTYPNTKYRCVFRFKKPDTIISFSIGDSSSYNLDPLNPSIDYLLKENINSIEFLYESNNGWRALLNGKSITGTGESLFDPSMFNPSGNLYPILTIETGNLEIIEIKNQVFNPVTYNTPAADWSNEFNDIINPFSAGGIGEAKNDLTYSDASLNREIIWVFNENISNGAIKESFEDLRIWTDLDYSTTVPTIGRYDPGFSFTKWNSESGVGSIIYGTAKDEGASHDIREVDINFDTFYPYCYEYGQENGPYLYSGAFSDDYEYLLSLEDELGLAVEGTDNIAYLGLYEGLEFSNLLPDNIKIKNFYWEYNFGTHVGAEDISIDIHLNRDIGNGYHLRYSFDPLTGNIIPHGASDLLLFDSNGMSLKSELFEVLNQIHEPSAQYYTSYYSSKFGDYEDAFTYTDNMNFGKVYIGAKGSNSMRIYTDYIKLVIETAAEPITFEDLLLGKQYNIPNRQLNDFYILNNEYNAETISNTVNFDCSNVLLSDYSIDLASTIFPNAFGSNSISFNMRSKVLYPNFAKDSQLISAINRINDFRIVPKLKSDEGEGMSNTTYPYQTSWWNQHKNLH